MCFDIRPAILLKGFPGFYGRAKSPDLVFITSACQNDNISRLISQSLAKALNDRPALYSLGEDYSRPMP